MKYCVRFVRKDGQPNEEYFYSDIWSAENHLKKFINDNSGLYRTVSILEVKSNTVLNLLYFENGIYQYQIKMDTFVRLKPKYCSLAERRYIYIVTNINEATERCNIVCASTTGGILIAETVGLEMITPVSRREPV